MGEESGLINSVKNGIINAVKGVGEVAGKRQLG